jgi:hypothetical protein
VRGGKLHVFVDKLFGEGSQIVVRIRWRSQILSRPAELAEQFGNHPDVNVVQSTVNFLNATAPTLVATGKELSVKNSVSFVTEWQ